MYGIITLFPVFEYTLCCFTLHLADEGLALQTVKAYLSAVQNLQLTIGLPDMHNQSSLPILKKFGFFRLGELLVPSPGVFDPATCLCWSDVAVDSISPLTMVRFHLHQSKCDQFGRGVDVVVSWTGILLCC